jgi:hypothetical protein
MGEKEGDGDTKEDYVSRGEKREGEGVGTEESFCVQRGRMEGEGREKGTKESFCVPAVVHQQVPRGTSRATQNGTHRTKSTLLQES